MVQQIYNNYSPQGTYYNRQMPLPTQRPMGPVYYYPANPQQQVAKNALPPVTTNYYTPEMRNATQNIFNQPQYNQAYYNTQQPGQTYQTNNVNADACPWVTDPELKLALNKLAEIVNDPNDVAYLRSIGINPPFNSGKEALDFIAQNKVQVMFADMGDSLAHAQYINDENKIIINQKYQGKMTLPMALAIADAIYHEAGHARDRDDVSSLQEELDCLSLNVLGYRHQQRYYPEVINASGQSRLISDGVGLYPKLMFDPDPNKTALIKRLADKYGFLPVSSPNHVAPMKPITASAKELFDLQNQKT